MQPTNMDQPDALETDKVTVRHMAERDLDAIVKIDATITGCARKEYYQQKHKAALHETGVKISLVAELEGFVAGFLMGSVYYGEFGRVEPTAVIDTVGVAPDYRNRHVGHALMRQLLMNLRGLRVEKVQTQVDWNEWELLQFFMRQGFQPVPRLCLEFRL